MLTSLTIANIVLIDQAELTFGKGLSVLSGETGAGKSILLDSLGLALGSKGEGSLVRNGQSQGSVVAQFMASKNTMVAAWFETQGLQADENITIRRTLTAAGKGKCFVNEQPIGVAELKELGASLVEIHGQHDQRTLFDPATHRALLDSYGKHGSALATVRSAYEAWSSAKRALAVLEKEMSEAKREEDYLRHIIGELGALRPESGEEETLTDQRAEMMQHEKLFGLLDEALAGLRANNGLSAEVRSIQRGLLRSPLTQSEKFQPIIDALEKASDGLDFADEQIEAIGHDTDYNQQRLEDMEERLFALKAAARKYNVPVDDLNEVWVGAKEAIATLDKKSNELPKLQMAVKETREAYRAVAGELTQKRIKVAEKLEKAVIKELKPLKMDGTAFKAQIVTQDKESEWAGHGIDAVEFVVATNVSGIGEPHYSPMQKIASGGELSRFMLALKVSLATTDSVPTMIFDEIDSGTGGAVADAIGQRLAKLAGTAQILVVTHLPQVAAQGNQHVLVSKAKTKDGVLTTITQLNDAARREELARMLAGSTITDEARKAADKLLEAAA